MKKVLWLAPMLALLACQEAHPSELAVVHGELDVDYYPALTDDLTVNGTCSLREAFRAISLKAVVDTCPAGKGSLDFNNIHLPAGTMSATLSGADDASLSGDFDVGANIRIFGATDGETILDMNSIDRAIQSQGPYSLEIYDLTIREGCANGTTCLTDAPSSVPQGGGVFYNGYGTFKFIRSRVEGSRARAGGGLGIYTATNSNSVVEDSEIVGNSATLGGGGIDSTVSYVLRNSVVESNTASSSNATGAGLRQTDRVLTIDNCTVRNNASSGAGGGASAVGNGAAATAGWILATNSRFENNTANSGGGNFFANAGTGGAGIFNVPCSTTGCLITLTNTLVTGGNADMAPASPAGSGGNLLANATSATPGKFELRGSTAVSMGIDPSTPLAPDCSGEVHLYDTATVAVVTGCGIQDHKPVGPVCGNGVVEAGEQCEGSVCCQACAFTTNSCSDGNACTVGDVCNGAGTCLPGNGSACGDGVLQAACGEQCDDGAHVSHDGCSAACLIEQCLMWSSPGDPPPQPDASVTDGSTPDASAPDGGSADGGSMDAGTADAGSDAGADAGACTPWTDTVDVPPGFQCLQEPPPDQGPFNMRVALTFDDGPSFQTTPSVLATLRARAIPATFFMLGQRLANTDNRALAREIHLDPLFDVANHTFTHATLTTLDLPTAQLEIDNTTDEIQSALSDPCFYPRYFRFPHGASNCDTMELAHSRGFGVAGVNIDTQDWCYAAGNGTCSHASVPLVAVENESNMIAHVLSVLAQTQGGIMLMHDIHPNTAANLPALLDQMLALGVTFVRLDDPTLFPLINGQVHAPDPPACCNGVVHQ